MTTSAPKVNQVLKVRRSAVGIDKSAAYAWAVCKGVNKKFARIVLLNDKSFTECQNTLTVKFEHIWLVKASARAALERKRLAQKAKDIDDDDALINELLDPSPDKLWDNPVKYHSPRLIDGLSCVAEATMKHGTKLMLVHGGVTDFTADAIVNAANEGCLGGGGIDGRINDLGGSVLAEARLALPILDPWGHPYGVKRCSTGDAKITVAGDLACKHVIHAVGPRFCYYPPFDDDLALLHNAYMNALMRAKETGLTKVAFCILSAGIFRGGCSLRNVVDAGIKAVAANTYDGLESVSFCAFTPQEQSDLEAVVFGVCTEGDR